MTLADYANQYWLSALLITGTVIAGICVYKYWDKIVIKGSGRK
ncbi:hypothetical protein P9314_23970 [Paenibacillus validus]|nr:MULTISPECIES: hypothetical protein [Paenibacillus]MED4603691.1 hypothetical protein [Paenibacillus validus]MED4609250.1 hypothetical protein [Paenibacillus validus]